MYSINPNSLAEKISGPGQQLEKRAHTMVRTRSTMKNRAK